MLVEAADLPHRRRDRVDRVSLHSQKAPPLPPKPPTQQRINDAPENRLPKDSGARDFRASTHPCRDRAMRAPAAVPLARFVRRRRASFTDRESRKVRATSGSRRTRFVPADARRKYFPRTPPAIAEKPYSGRRSSPGFLRILRVLMAFSACCLSGADDSNPFATVGVRNHDDTPLRRLTDRHEPMLRFRVVRVRHRPGERIQEDRGRLTKLDAVPSSIRRGLP